MFSSFTSFSSPFTVPRFLQPKSASAIDLPSVEIHDVETNPEKRARTLKHLLKLNHANHAILFNHRRFHNHMPHLLGSAYFLKASPNHLDDIYEHDAKTLEPWTDSPNEVSTFDWRDYLGDPQYQRAYLDFFEDQNVLNGYDWKKVLNIYLFQGKEPLFHNLVAGLGHPLIHLGYAYELNSREVAMEALAMATTQYNFLHKYLDDPSYTHPPKPASSSPVSPSTSTLSLLHALRSDTRLDHRQEPADSFFTNNIASLFTTHEAVILEYWNAWQLSSPKKQFEESQRTATTLFVGSHNADGSKTYDFFLVHLLTTSHAVRILLPLIPAKYHLALVRQWWLIVIAIYITQGRPAIDEGRFMNHDIGEKGWEWVDKQATEGKWSLEDHVVKALRGMKVAAETWGDGEELYLRAAVKTAEEFDGWGGFGAVEVGGERRGSGEGWHQ